MNDNNGENEAKDTQLQLAKQRTEAANRRTILADERTFSAWIRTGLASLATGLAIVKLMADSGPTWMIRSLGILFVAVGGGIFLMAFGAYRRAVSPLDKPVGSGIPIWAIPSLTFALLVGAMAALWLVFTE